jgi:heavy metal sensor kinase
MSLKRRLKLPNTLAFRLTVWYAGILVLSTSIAFFLFYAFITKFIFNQIDQELKSQANRFAILLASEGSSSVVDSALIEAHAAGVKKVFFRFLSVSGEVFSSSDMSYWKDINIGVDESAIKAVLTDNQYVFQTIAIPGRPEKVRILYAMLSPTIIMQVGEAMESEARFLDAFQRIFIATLAFLIVLATGGGWFMARRAVSGVEAVTRTAQKISAGTLQERVPVKARGDEIDTLARTFNQMLDRIQALLKEIEEMSDNIAHDLRSPIARIRGTAEVTLTSGKDRAEFENMAGSTIEECDRLLDMINTMLMISKTESGVNKVSSQNLDMTGVVRQAYELFEPTAEDQQVHLHCDAPSGIYMLGDLSMIQRMISNLLDNAIKYTPAGGTVQITLAENRSHVSLTFKDSGVGISATDLSRIFNRFYRCDQSRSLPGTGLGLSLARAIARAHSGDITVVSTPGHGSTFTITLPKTSSSQTR